MYLLFLRCNATEFLLYRVVLFTSVMASSSNGWDAGSHPWQSGEKLPEAILQGKSSFETCFQNEVSGPPEWVDSIEPQVYYNLYHGLIV